MIILKDNNETVLPLNDIFWNPISIKPIDGSLIAINFQDEYYIGIYSKGIVTSKSINDGYIFLNVCSEWFQMPIKKAEGK